MSTAIHLLLVVSMVMNMVLPYLAIPVKPIIDNSASQAALLQTDPSPTPTIAADTQEPSATPSLEPSATITATPTATSEPSLVPSQTATDTPTPAATLVVQTPSPSATSGQPVTATPTAAPTDTTTPTATPNGHNPHKVGKGGGEVNSKAHKLNIKLKFPKDALEDDNEITIETPPQVFNTMPYKGFEPFQINAKNTANGKATHQLKKYYKIEITYDPAELGDTDPSALSLFWHDDDKGYWQPIFANIYPDKNLIETYIDHFSDFALGENSWDSHKLPDLTSAQVAGFTGSAAYSIPIEAPLGPGGMKASVSLNYNSMSAEGMFFSQYVYDTVRDSIDSSQASYTGLGWSLSGDGSITRDLGKDLSNKVDDTFSFSAGGVSNKLVGVENHSADASNPYTGFRLQDDNFWIIRYYNIQNNNHSYNPDNGLPCSGGACYTANLPSEDGYWMAWDKTGTRYTFNSRAYYVEYTVDKKIFRPWKWLLTEVRFPSGQILTYTYKLESDQKCYAISAGGCDITYQTDVGVYPAAIQYPNAGTKITFGYEDRPDRTYYWGDSGYRFHYEKSRLHTIQVSLNGAIAHEYILGYMAATQASVLPGARFTNIDPSKGGTLDVNGVSILSSVTEYGAGGVSGGVKLPATTFTYNSMLLSGINNGYGGHVLFTYDPTDTSQATAPFLAANAYGDKFTLYNGSGLNLVSGSTETLGIGINPDPETSTPKTMPVRPGLGYRIQCYISNNSSLTQITYYMLYDKNNAGNYSSTALLDTTAYYNNYVAGNLVIPPTATKAEPKIHLAWGANFTARDCSLNYVYTHYRVTQKKLQEDVTGQSYTYTYAYTGAAVNDPAHSAFASSNVSNSTTYPMSIRAYSEFRGHSMTSVTNPNNTITQTYYLQSDDYKGTVTDVVTTDLSTNKVIASTHYNYAKNDSAYNRAYTPPTGTGQTTCARDSATNTCFIDMVVRWTHILDQTDKTYPSSNLAPTGQTIPPVNYVNSVGTQRKYIYDITDQAGAQWGNATRMIEREWNGSLWDTSPARATKTRFAPNTNTVNDPAAVKNLIGLPGIVKAYQCSSGTCDFANANLKAGSCNIYDNPQNGGPGICNVEAETLDTVDSALPTGLRTLLSTGMYHDEQYRYDNWGNRTTTTVYSGTGTATAIASSGVQTTKSCYSANSSVAPNCPDDTIHTYKVWETNPAGHVTRWSWDNQKGVLLQQTDANSQVTSATYDAFGRMLKLVRPGDTSTAPTSSATYSDTASPVKVAPFFITISDRINATTTKVTRKYWDGLNRLVQTQVDADLDIGASKIVAISTIYDTANPTWVAQQSTAYVVNTPSDATSKFCGSTGCVINSTYGRFYTTTLYDKMGRTTKVTSPNTTHVDTAYALADDTTYTLMTSVTDANGNINKTYTDGWGRNVKVVSPSSASIQVMYYAYDELNRMTFAWTDPTRKNAFTYDLGGRKSSSLDNDTTDTTNGNTTWNYYYDALGNLTRQKDAKGQRTCLYYDSLNRLLGKHYRSDDACPSSPTYAVSYGYDAGTNQKGYRTSMTDASGSAVWSYDARGRMTQESRTITGTNGGTFTTQWSYDSADLVETMKYPADAAGNLGETLTTTYLRQGVASTLSNGTLSYITSTLYDATGRVLQLALNNVVYRKTSYYAWNTATTGGRLSAITAGTSPTDTSLLNIPYSTYDANGNIKLYDGNSGRKYTYDSLNRVATESGLLTSTFSYDLQGRVTKSDTATTIDYPVSYNHRAGTITPDSLTIPLYTYGYDNNGNVTSITYSGRTPSLTLGYDAENHLTSASGINYLGVTVSDTFRYDGNGKLISMKDSTGKETVLIGSYFEWTGSAATAKSYYYAGGMIAMRVGSSRDTSGLGWVLTDHLGSLRKILNAANPGDVTNRVYYTSGVTQSETIGTLDTTLRFTGQRLITELGLYFYQSRWYDPVSSRWLQADTIIPYPFNPMSWDRFSYVRNNPVNYTDPTGHIEACEENCSEQRRLTKLYDSLGAEEYFKHEIKGQFGVEMALKDITEGVKWSKENLMTAYHALFMVDSQLNGNLKAVVDGSKFILANGGNKFWGDAATSSQVTFHVFDSGTHLPLINFLHETGHLLDNLPKLMDVFSGPLGTKPGWVDSEGFVDETLLKGEINQPVQSKYIIDENGNRSEAFHPSEYWADSFANYVAGNIDLSDPLGKAMANYVNGALYPYSNP